MSDKEIAVIAKTIRMNGKKLSSDKAKTKVFLKKLGIFDKNGNVTDAYKEICIPIERV